MWGRYIMDIYRYLLILYLWGISIASLECCQVPKNWGFAQEEYGDVTWAEKEINQCAIVDVLASGGV